mgnify:CR=1 FL=1
MANMDYLKFLVEEIHSTTVATIGSGRHPQTRIIDMMYYDADGVYFLTAKGKAFYETAYGAAVCGNIGDKRQARSIASRKRENIGKRI